MSENDGWNQNFFQGQETRILFIQQVLMRLDVIYSIVIQGLYNFLAGNGDIGRIFEWNVILGSFLTAHDAGCWQGQAAIIALEWLWRGGRKATHRLSSIIRRGGGLKRPRLPRGIHCSEQHGGKQKK
jgi:hypothetical protein